MFSFTCPNPSTHPLVSASQKLIELLEIAIRSNDPRFSSVDVESIVAKLYKCQKDFIKYNYRRSSCNQPICPICGKMKVIYLWDKKVKSALLTYLHSFPTGQYSLEVYASKVKSILESRSIIWGVLSPRSCDDPKDIRSSFDNQNEAIAALYRRPSFPVTGYNRFNELKVNNKPGDKSFGLYQPHTNIFYSIDTSDPKARSFWEKDQTEYISNQFMELMGLDYPPDFWYKTVLTASEVNRLICDMDDSDCTTQEQCIKYLSKWSEAIPDHCNVEKIVNYVIKGLSKATMIPDKTISLDRRLDILSCLLTDFHKLNLVASGGSLKLLDDPYIKTWIDFV